MRADLADPRSKVTSNCTSMTGKGPHSIPPSVSFSEISASRMVAMMESSKTSRSTVTQQLPHICMQCRRNPPDRLRQLWEWIGGRSGITGPRFGRWYMPLLVPVPMTNPVPTTETQTRAKRGNIHRRASAPRTFRPTTFGEGQSLTYSVVMFPNRSYLTE